MEFIYAFILLVFIWAGIYLILCTIEEATDKIIAKLDERKKE